MKNKAFSLFFSLLFSIILVSCGDKESDEPNSPSKKYYVKYEYSVSTRYVGFTYNATVTTPNGSQTFTPQTTKWEATFGPFSRLEDLSLLCACETDYVTTTSRFSGRISISIDDGPFVLKAEGNSDYRPLSLHYQVIQSDLK